MITLIYGLYAHTHIGYQFATGIFFFFPFHRDLMNEWFDLILDTNFSKMLFFFFIKPDFLFILIWWGIFFPLQKIIHSDVLFDVLSKKWKKISISNRINNRSFNRTVQSRERERDDNQLLPAVIFCFPRW